MNVFYFGWEESFLMWLQNNRNDALDFIFPKLTFLGNAGWFWIVTAVMIFIFYKKDRRFGWSAVLSITLAFIVCNLLLKNLVNRARPCDIWDTIEIIVKRPMDSSFPSGHTNASFAVSTAILLRNKKWGIPSVILAALIAFSRMYLFMHFPTDVLTGAINGVVWAIVSYFIINYVYKKTGKEIDRY